MVKGLPECENIQGSAKVEIQGCVYPPERSHACFNYALPSSLSDSDTDPHKSSFLGCVNSPPPRPCITQPSKILFCGTLFMYIVCQVHIAMFACKFGVPLRRKRHILDDQDQNDIILIYTRYLSDVLCWQLGSMKASYARLS